MGGLVHRTESAVLSGLPLTSAGYCDFRTHGPHMRIDDLSAPSGRFVARVSSSVTTVDRCPGRRRALPTADNVFSSVSPYPPRSARAPQKPLLPRRPSPCRILHGVPHRGLTRSRPRARPRPPLPRLALGEAVLGPNLHPDSPAYSNSSWCCTTCCRLLLCARRGPSTVCRLTPPRESHGRGRVRPPPRPLLLPPRRSQRCQYRPTATSQSLWKLLCYGLGPFLATHRLHLPSWIPLATLLNCSSLIPSRVIRMPIASDNSRLSRCATPQCVTSPSAGRRPCQPTFSRATLSTTNCLYRRMRIGAARRKLSRNHGECFLAPGYACVPRAEWLCRYRDTVLPNGAHV